LYYKGSRQNPRGAIYGFVKSKSDYPSYILAQQDISLQTFFILKSRRSYLIAFYRLIPLCTFDFTKPEYAYSAIFYLLGDLMEAALLWFSPPRFISALPLFFDF
jgi:hypothetical protein